MALCVGERRTEGQISHAEWCWSVRPRTTPSPASEDLWDAEAGASVVFVDLFENYLSARA